MPSWKFAAKGVDNVNPRSRVNIGRAIVKKQSYRYMYNVEVLADFFNGKNVMHSRFSSLTILVPAPYALLFDNE
jgi:hypothetical protein